MKLSKLKLNPTNPNEGGIKIIEAPLEEIEIKTK
jgi:hypothetical protein